MSNKNNYSVKLNKINGRFEQLEQLNFVDYHAAVAFCNMKIQDVSYEEITLYYHLTELASWNWYLPRYIDIFGSFLPEPECSRLVNHYKNLLNIPVFENYGGNLREKYRKQYDVATSSLPKSVADTAKSLVHEYATRHSYKIVTLRDLIIREKFTSDDLFSIVTQKIQLVEMLKAREEYNIDPYRDIYVPLSFLEGNGEAMIYSSVINMSRLIRKLGFPGFYDCEFFVSYFKNDMERKDADEHIETDRKVKYRRFFDETMWEKTKVDSEINDKGE